MSLRLDQPDYLWLAVLAIPLAALALAWFASMSRPRLWSAIVLRSSLVILLALILAGVSQIRTTRKLAVIAVVDVSDSVRRWGSVAATLNNPSSRSSMTDRVKTFIAASTKERGSEDLLGIVAFDAKPVALVSPTLADAAQASLDVRIVPGTNIADALQLARAMIPQDAAGRIVLFSDGVPTMGDTLAAATPSSGNSPRVPIDVVPIEYNVADEVTVDAVDAPPNAPPESTVTVRVTINATSVSNGLLRLFDGEKPLDISGEVSEGRARRLSLAPGQSVISLQVKLDHARVHRFRAVYEPDMQQLSDGSNHASGDTLTENNAAEGFTITPGTGSVLLLDGNAQGNLSRSTLAATLRSKGIDVHAVSPTDFPGDLVSLQAYDLVILENVASEEIPDEAQNRLVAFVRDLGGGLIMVGGPNAFGAGGWNHSPIEPLLPVRLDLPDRVVSRQVATLFVIDVSGSMGWPALGSTRTKQEIANESAALAISRMEKSDIVGIIAFNQRPTTILPLTVNADPQRSAAKAREMLADGGTNMGPALDEALRQLRASDSKFKHIIVLSDGRSQGRNTLPEKADAIKAAGIRLSTIGVGDDADDAMMELIAQRGDGVYYKVLNADRLPATFLSAVRVVRSPAIREAPFQPIILPSGSPALTGIASTPSLKGLVITQPRPELNILNAIASPDGEPVLAHWNYELGRVAAFTSDASIWAQDWLPWSGFDQFWTQLARIIARPSSSRFMQGEARVDGDRVLLRVEANSDDGKPLNALRTPLVVFAPDGTQTNAQLDQTAPGIYEGHFTAGAAGTYVAIVKPSEASQSLSPVVIGVNVRSNSELRTLKSNRDLLVRLADASGGRVLSLQDPEAQPIFDRSTLKPREVATNIWRSLLVVAIAVLLLDIATRRVAWDRWISPEFGDQLARDAASSQRERGILAAQTLGGLRSRQEVASQNSGVSTPLVLSEEDAKRLAEAARDRRRAQRLSTHATPPSSPSDQPPHISPPIEVAKDAPLPGEGGLLAAKRRASQRFEDA